MEIELYSPTGQEIRGTYEKVPGSAGVIFSMEEGVLSYDHDGNGTEMFWDGQLTQEVDDVALFTDTDGHDWLLHHLIPNSEALSGDTIALIRNELHIGDALEAARALDKAMDAARPGWGCTASVRAPLILSVLSVAYAEAKAASIAAIQKELAAR